MSATLGTDPTVDSPFIVRLRFDDSSPVSPVARLSKHSRVQRKGVSVILTSCGRPVKLRPRFRTRATRSRAGDGARDPHVPVAAPRPTGGESLGKSLNWRSVLGFPVISCVIREIKT
ncbi:hypothetical protein OPV22_000710 [Ensete ventricosum]|uniref:Uncharacterized protein n=1 Tax=Ensete ventricosum TaxID=4639 RepID=A0AAV8QA53_ENSVE|nr:hypothetical protein OPV22_000710 [Ensete ventricosum]